MPNQFNSYDSWLNPLVSSFTSDAKQIGERLHKQADAEKVCSEKGPGDLKNFSLLSTAFFDFAGESLDLLAESQVYHVMRIPFFVSSISRLRASSLLFWNGYYYDAGSLLRGLFENAVHLCAAAHDWADLQAWMSEKDLDPSVPDFARKLKRRRIEHDKFVESRVFGKDSGLPQSHQDEIATWMDFFHAQVHKTQMHHIALLGNVLVERKPAALAPFWETFTGSYYANSSVAISWMFLRLFSFAVPEALRSPAWVKRRDEFENAFRFVFEEWGRPIALTVIYLVDAQFSFPGEWKQPPADE